MHFWAHHQLNSHVTYKIFIRVKNVWQKLLEENEARILCSVHYFCKFYGWQDNFKKWANVPDYGIHICCKFLCVGVICCFLVSDILQAMLRHINIDPLSVFCIHIVHKMFWHFSYILWLYRKNINYRNYSRPFLYC